MYSFYKQNWANFCMNSWAKQDIFAIYCHDGLVSKIDKLWIIPLPFLDLKQQDSSKFFFDHSFERNINYFYL